MAITKKIIIGFIAISVLWSAAAPAFAIEWDKPAEQEYPKIPLPGYEQSYSLDDIMKPTSKRLSEVEDATKFCQDLGFETLEECRRPEKLEGVDALGFLALYIFMLILYLAGIIAFAILVFLGIRLITSKGQPLVRKEIRDKVIRVLWGLGLLLGAYIILNTINPELTFIHRPGVSPIESEDFSFSYDYGLADIAPAKVPGVVLFGDANIDGSSGKSQVVLNDIKNMQNSTFVGHDQLSGIIIGKCKITLYENDNFNEEPGKSWVLQGPGSGISGENTFADNTVSSLKFNDRSCLGHSVTVYQDANFTGASKAFLWEDENLNGNILRHHALTGQPATEMSSLKLAHPVNDDGFIVSIFENQDFRQEEGKRDQAVDDESADIGGNWVSSIRLDLENEVAKQNRAKGVILYDKEDFGVGEKKTGISEIFLTSDANIDAGNALTHKENKNRASSMRIIGQYRVTLYSEPEFKGEWIEFTNNINNAHFQSSAGEEGDLMVEDRMLNINNLTNYTFTKEGDNWNDKLRSIKIEPLF